MTNASHDNAIRKVVIAGGGTAGWVAAAALSSKFDQLLDITVVESEQIGTIGVGEATIPTATTFHRLIGIDEREFMRATNATFKVGISFENWGQQGDQYIHSFGGLGQSSWLADFHHFWLYANALGVSTDLGDYSAECIAGKAGRFEITKNNSLNYAYHLDSGLYAKFLQNKSVARGVKRIEGIIETVEQDQETGDITSLVTDKGDVVNGDLFIDCTGFRALLIEQTLNTGFESWSQYLPCDRAVAVQTESTGEPAPLTRSIAHDAGWRWRIPLQHRVGNGLVYSSQHLSDDEAKHRLLQMVEGPVINEPRLIRYQSGRRNQVWNKNCIALGLATGFVEPLESTSIHLFMTGVIRLMELFPFSGVTDATRDEYNRLCKNELVDIRDFIVLHYHVTERDDSDFWRHCRTMNIPATLKQRIDLFKQQAHAYQGGEDLFRMDSWVQVMIGQRLMPKHHHMMVENMSESELPKFLAHVAGAAKAKVAPLCSHQQFINRYCKSN